MYQGVHSDDLERYHDAPVYQTRRDIARLYRDLAPDLRELLDHGRSSVWNRFEIKHPQNFQFFRRSWEGSFATFSWMSYLVEQFSVDRVKEIGRLLREPVIEDRTPLELLALYFGTEPQSSHIHQSLNVLAEVQGMEVNDEIAALFHHELLNVYSRIAARGSILHHIWEDYTTDGDEAPLGYLVQVTRDSMHGGFPDFFSWDVLDAPEFQYFDRKLRPQEAIDIRANSRMRRADERALSTFFQNCLYPLFAYPNIDLPSSNPTTEGHVQEGIFGFLFVPFYPLYVQTATEPGSLIRRHFGDWVGVLQIELRTEGEKSRELLATPALDVEKLGSFLRVVHSSLDDRVDRLVESSAVRWAESQDRMDDPHELCARSIARSVGWEASLATANFEGPVSRDTGLGEDGARFWVQLDWEWPRRRRLPKRTAIAVSLATSHTLTGSRRGPRLPSTDLEWRDVLPQAYELCRGIHRSVFTWWHAQRSRRIDVSAQLQGILSRTADWFGTNKQLPDSIPHTLPILTLQVVQQHAAAVRRVLPFLPEAWWCTSLGDFDGATGEAVKALHENLKATFGRHACVSGGGRSLTVGGALVLFMMVLHAEFPGGPSMVELTGRGFGYFKRQSPLLPLQTHTESLEAYESLAALFRDVVKLKHTAGLAVKDVVVDEFGRFFDVILDWDTEDQRRFFAKFSGTRREILPDGDALGNTVNALWSVIIAGSSGAEVVGRPGLVWFTTKSDSFRLRVG